MVLLGHIVLLFRLVRLCLVVITVGVFDESLDSLGMTGLPVSVLDSLSLADESFFRSSNAQSLYLSLLDDG